MSARPRIIVSAAAMLAMLGAGPVAARDADPAVQSLPGTTLNAVTVDLDGDGAREVLRLTDVPGPGFLLEAWEMRDGWWRTDRSTEVAPDHGAAPPDASAEIASLLIRHHEGTERAVLVTAVGQDGERFGFGATCCVAISEVRLGGESLELVPMPFPELGAQEIQIADLDGDRTDELIVSSTTGATSDAPITESTILEWDGSRWSPSDLAVIESGWGRISAVAPSTPSAVFFGPSADGELTRVTAPNGRGRVETDHIDLGQQFEGWIAGATAERLLIVGSDGIRMIHWPAGGTPAVAGHVPTSSYPSVAMTGDGPETLVLTMDGAQPASDGPPTVSVRDASLRLLGTVEPGEATIGVWAVLRPDLNYGAFSRNIFPYFGPLPGAIEGRPASVASGMLIQPDGLGGFDHVEIASFVGMQPVGRAGPDDGWLALGDGYFGGGRYAYLFPIGSSFPLDAGRFVIATIDRMLAPGPGQPAARLVDAVELPTIGGETNVLAPADGFEIEISAEPGSLVITTMDNRLETRDVGSAPVSLEVRPPRRAPDDEDVPFERWIAVIAPDGRSSTLHLRGTFVRTDPSVSARATTPMFGTRATIEGRASPMASVAVNGETVAVNADGRFSAEVDAPFWPTDVIVVARDPFGRETASRLQVVGFLDYRGLPWVAIVGAGILGAGAWLFLRTPGRRNPVPVAFGGDGTLEELDAD